MTCNRGFEKEAKGIGRNGENLKDTKNEPEVDSSCLVLFKTYRAFECTVWNIKIKAPFSREIKMARTWPVTRR